MTSAAQDQWVEIMAAVRAKIAQQVKHMGGELGPDGDLTFIALIDAAMDAEMKAANYDQAAECISQALQRGEPL